MPLLDALVLQRNLRVRCPRTEQLAANNRRRKDLYSLPLADQQLLEGLGYKDKLIDIDRAIMANEFFIQQMVANPEIFADDGEEEEEEIDMNEEQGKRTEKGKGRGPSRAYLIAFYCSGYLVAYRTAYRIPFA